MPRLAVSARQRSEALSYISQTVFKKLHRIVLLVSVLAILLGALSGCKKQTRRTTTLANTPAVKADSAEAQRSFDDALDALEQGRYRESQEAFKAVQANHEGDAIAPVAELYAVRAEVGQIVLEEGAVRAPELTSQGSERIDALTSRLQALSSARRVDERIRWSARVYEAILWSIASDTKRAAQALEGYPSASLSALILDQDRALAWLLLLGAMERSDRPEEAFVAAAMLWQSAQDLRLTDAVSNRLVRFARAKGASIALEAIDEESLQLQFLTSDSAFLRGFAGWALIVRHKDDRDIDQEAMGKVYGVASVALLDVGAMEQAAEINAYLATMDTTDRIVIGALIPMQGENKGIGARVMRGLLLAQQSYTGETKGARLTLLFRDSTRPAEENMAWFKRQGTLAIVGPIDRALVSAYSTQAQKEEIVLLPLTPQALASGGEKESLTWTFRYFLDIESEARAVARIAATQYQDKTAAIIWPNVGYGQTMAKAFREEFTARGGTIVAEVEYPREDTEFTRTAAKVSKAKPDAIFIPDTGKKVSEIVSFLAKENVWGVPGAQVLDRKSRLQTHYLGTSLWQDPFLVQHAATYVAGATIPVWFSRVAGDEKTKAFLSHYAKVFASGEPTIYEAFAYDATELLEQLVLQQSSLQSAAIRDAFLIGQWEGVTGKVKFTSSGEPERELRLLTVKKGEFSPLDLRQLVDAPKPSN